MQLRERPEKDWVTLDDQGTVSYGENRSYSLDILDGKRFRHWFMSLQYIF